jgi:hypothetical protein
MGTERKLLKWLSVALIFAVILLTPLLTLAGGGQHAIHGLTGAIPGVTPPPGLYFADFNGWYGAKKLKDNSGDTLKLERDGVEFDKLNVFFAAPSLTWISKYNILGASYGQRYIGVGLLIENEVDVLTPGGPLRLDETRAGIFDFIWAPIVLGWHRKDGLLHATAELDVFMPVGNPNPRNLVNINKNFWTFEPGFAVTGFSPFWDQRLAASVWLRYDFNTVDDNFLISPGIANKIGNPALAGVRTHNTPGQEFHLDWAVDFAVYEKLRVGLLGFYYQQITDDETGRGTVRNDKGRTIGIGPHAWVPYKKWIFEGHVTTETGVKNRPQGVIASFNVLYKIF